MAIELMMPFAERTGLTSDRPPQRYLWTDAFAVCNFLEIARGTGEDRYTDLALRLINEVHHTLGQHRADDTRSGWLRGLSGPGGESHPTRGGLRIGKKLPERRPGEPFDADLEWERDGQYFHYLTKWMHALDQASRSLRRPLFNLWARELAEAAYAAFSYEPPGEGRRRMVWKMSLDLSRPLVPSMGQHDPLDGFITCAQLQATAVDLACEMVGPDLKREVDAFAAMIEAGSLTTADPLGIGGLLMDACRVAQLMRRGTIVKDELLPTLLAAALVGLAHLPEQGDLRRPASRRLAFRELGLAIGLDALDHIEREIRAEPGRFSQGSESLALLERLRPHSSLGSVIEAFWLDPEHRRDRAWSEHRDINDVMLATSVVPEGFLILTAVD